MRAKEAKTIQLSAYLNLLGMKPAKSRHLGQELRYCSPIRSGDTNPSFKVDTKKNVRFDQGIAKGGTIIDLVMEISHVSVKEALAVLERSGLPVNTPYSVSTLTLSSKIPLAGEKEKASLEVISVGDIRSPALLQYLEKRKLNLEIANKYLKEVRYKHPNKLAEFFGLGWKCGDGYEVNSALFKGFVGKHKDISRIGLADNKSLSIFEGFFDFLSFLSHYKIAEFQNSAIILNGIALKKKALEEIESFNFDKVYLFLDNDEGGKSCKEFFEFNLDNIEIIDNSSIYTGFKDFNEMAIQKSR